MEKLSYDIKIKLNNNAYFQNQVELLSNITSDVKIDVNIENNDSIIFWDKNQTGSHIILNGTKTILLKLTTNDFIGECILNKECSHELLFYDKNKTSFTIYPISKTIDTFKNIILKINPLLNELKKIQNDIKKNGLQSTELEISFTSEIISIRYFNGINEIENTY
jgi:hypothetical protein